MAGPGARIDSGCRVAGSVSVARFRSSIPSCLAKPVLAHSIDAVIGDIPPWWVSHGGAGRG